jgi:hypothetical protein
VDSPTHDAAQRLRAWRIAFAEIRAMSSPLCPWSHLDVCAAAAAVVTFGRAMNLPLAPDSRTKFSSPSWLSEAQNVMYVSMRSCSRLVAGRLAVVEFVIAITRVNSSKPSSQLPRTVLCECRVCTTSKHWNVWGVAGVRGCRGVGLYVCLYVCMVCIVLGGCLRGSCLVGCCEVHTGFKLITLLPF